MNEPEVKDVPDASGGYVPRPGEIPCTDPPGIPGFPNFPGMPGPRPWPGDTEPTIPVAPLY